MRTLGQLKPGESGYVRNVSTSDAKVRRRLIDMGITPFTQIMVRKVAPLGDPIEINLRGYELSIRQADALQITLLEDGEAQGLLEKQKEDRISRQQAALKALEEKQHPKDTDEQAHKNAIKLTEWIMTQTDAEDASCGTVCSGDCANCKATQKKSRREDKKTVQTAADEAPLKMALVGNPNCGKTTLFNAMTGAKEYVGNWPGVTVEKKEGRLRAYGHEITLVDLPGIYSLSPYSMEEVVARNYIVYDKPDAVINIVDGTNLERNLYLTVQLMELDCPMVLALNMMDEVEKKGDTINVRKLSLELGIPVVPISARTGEGVDELVRQCNLMLKLAHAQTHQELSIEPDDLYDDYTHMMHHQLGEIISDNADAVKIPRHWAAIKLLEGDQLVRDALQLSEKQIRNVDRILSEYADEQSGMNGEMRVADSRYRYITHISELTLKRKLSHGSKSFSDKVDEVLTSKIWAIPIFLVVMLVVFLLTFDTFGAWLSDLVDYLVNGLFAPWLEGILVGAGVTNWVVRLVCDGIIGGVGGVVTFLPQIALLFFFLSLLEDSGYISRTAFIMDKLLRRFGLSGKSFIPMLMGFGCTVPATMGARTMENQKDRRMTIMLLPFMSCSAKLPVYGLIASAFFAQDRALVVFSMYLLGILIGIASGFLFKHTIFKGETAPFVLELPPYRIPTAKNTFTHVWQRVKHFLEKAGTLILIMSVVLWFLQSFSPSFVMVGDASESLLGVVGTWIAPAFKPLGFGVWQAVVALLAGLFAKEAIVSSMSLFYGFSTVAGAGTIHAALAGTFTPLAAYSFLAFVALYVPCIASMATMRRELGSRKYMWMVVVYQVLVAYVAALLIFQIGSLFIG